MARRTILAAVLTLVGIALGGVAIWTRRPRLETIEIAQQTTYIVTPTRADGWVDYPTAVDWMRRASLDAGGANAAGPLVRALGRDVLPIGVERAALLERMGVTESADAPPLPSLKDFAGAGGAAGAEPPAEAMAWLRARCGAAGADASSLARIGAWLAAADRALADLREASRAASLYVPVSRDARGLGDFDRVNPLRLAEGAHALGCRAAVKLLAGDAPASWNDAEALWRLGQLVARAATTTEYALAETIWQAAMQATVDLAASPRTGAELLSAVQAGLGAKLGFPPATETWMFHRLEALEIEGTPLVVASPQGRPSSGPLARIGATATLEQINRECDAFDAALQGGGSGKQRIMRIEQATPAGGVAARGIALRTLAVELRGVSDQRLASLAVALARRQRDTGRLPASLAEIRDLPVDPGSGGPFHYAVEGGSVRLYGVGGDGLDNGGDPENDVVAAALPPLQAAAPSAAP